LLVTPNLPEASALLGREVRTADDMLPAARDLLALGPRAVLLKGGHLADMAEVGEDGVVQDVLVTADGTERIYAHTYIDTPHTHGTGCTLSAAIAAHLARGDTLEAAIEGALDYLLHAIGAGRHLALGRGTGPLNHGFAPRPLAAPRALELDDGD
jgi:hydroxymethylpyrimidine/phosphomethylpyrimidine kinase